MLRSFKRWMLAVLSVSLLIVAPAVATQPSVPTGKTLIRIYPALYAQAKKDPKVREGRDVLTHGRARDGRVIWALVRSESLRLWLEYHPAVKVELARQRVFVNITRHRPKWPVNKRIVYADWMANGRPEGDFSCLAKIVDLYENGTWQTNMTYGQHLVSVATLAVTGKAGGIPQAKPPSKMASAGADWKTNPVTQFRWMVGYANGTYGGACNALAYRKTHPSY